MNNNNNFSPYNNNIDPNKNKKCSCEDKVGPKPFNSNIPNNQTNDKK